MVKHAPLGFTQKITNAVVFLKEICTRDGLRLG